MFKIKHYKPKHPQTKKVAYGHGFIAIATNKRILCWRQTFLVLDTHAFCAGGDEHSSARDEHVENTRSNFSHTHTHTASYQQLPNRTYVELTSENVRFDAGEIRKLCRCTTASFKAKFIL